jgi:hypothetical protein
MPSRAGQSLRNWKNRKLERVKTSELRAVQLLLFDWDHWPDEGKPVEL